MVPRHEIQKYADQIARRFHPEQIILFGSHAYGTPDRDSDVDLMVVMNHRGDSLDQSVRISTTLEAPFAMDLLVSTPKRLRDRIAMGDSFLREIVDRGKVLYDAARTGVGGKSRRRLRRSRATPART